MKFNFQVRCVVLCWPLGVVALGRMRRLWLTCCAPAQFSNLCGSVYQKGDVVYTRDGN